jgi:hypothetical protein
MKNIKQRYQRWANDTSIGEFVTSKEGLLLIVVAVVLTGLGVTSCGSGVHADGLTVDHSEYYVQLNDGRQCTLIYVERGAYLDCPQDVGP